jgi:anti-sigma-K factor RskA
VNEDEFGELAAGHALHALSPDDERRYADAVAEHPEWQATADQDAATAAALADTAAEVAPPAHVRDALFAAIARDAGAQQAEAQAPVEAAEPTGPDASRRRRGLGRRGLFALAASIVVVLALGIGGIFIAKQFATPASSFALQQIEKQPDAQSATADVTGGGTATAHWSGSLGKAVLVSDDLAPIASGQVYEMWFVRDGTPVSAGLFDTSDGSATASLEGQMHGGDTIAVTVEPSGGSPTGKPTSAPIVAIPTA